MNSTRCTHRKVTLVPFNDRFAFPCKGCNQVGYGTCYHCADGCDYQVHEECLTASPVARYSFFGHEQFILQYCQQPANETGDFCTACGESVNGLLYVCHTLESGNKIFLHPCCIKLPLIFFTDDGDRLTLKSKLKYVSCQYCDKQTLDRNVDGWAYISSDQKSACHVQCMRKRLYDAWILNNQLEEPNGVANGPWWLNPNYNDALIPWDGSSSSSSPYVPENAWLNPNYNDGLIPCNASGSRSIPANASHYSCPSTPANTTHNSFFPSSPANPSQYYSRPSSPANATHNSFFPSNPANPSQYYSRPSSPANAAHNSFFPSSPANPSQYYSCPSSLAGSNPANASYNYFFPTSPANPSDYYSNPSSPAGSSHGHPQNSLALPTTTNPPGRKRQILWKFTKAAIKLFIHGAMGDPVGVIMAVHDLL